MSRQTRATTVVSQPPRLSTAVGVGATEPQPGLLHGVVGLVARPEHAQRHRPEVIPVGLEALVQGSSVAHGHILGLPHVILLTGQTGST